MNSFAIAITNQRLLPEAVVAVWLIISMTPSLLPSVSACGPATEANANAGYRLYMTLHIPNTNITNENNGGMG